MVLASVGNFVISVDTERLITRLQAVVPGAVITYADLSATIGRDVLDGARGQLRHARHKLLDEHRINFEAVVGQGLRRITDEEAALSGGKQLRRVRRAAYRGRKHVAAVREWDALPNAAKVASNATQAMLGAIEHAATVSKQKAIEGVIANAGALPTLAETVEHFKK
jgi:hypothetical protein